MEDMYVVIDSTGKEIDTFTSYREAYDYIFMIALYNIGMADVCRSQYNRLTKAKRSNTPSFEEWAQDYLNDEVWDTLDDSDEVWGYAIQEIEQ